ncbi:MAG: hypothetical protein JHD35_13000 [Sphingopyxis sp.]|nr:hypothetical protein [Sphingopyxis sp.]
MTGHRSRTYRLRLSEEGTDLFLAQHHRLARIARGFIPYGATLGVAVMLMEKVETDELVAELTMPSLKRLAGKCEHFVGATAAINDATGAIVNRLAESDLIGVRPSVGALHNLAIMLMESSEDHELAKAWQRVQAGIAKK